MPSKTGASLSQRGETSRAGNWVTPLSRGCSVEPRRVRSCYQGGVGGGGGAIGHWGSCVVREEHPEVYWYLVGVFIKR